MMKIRNNKKSPLRLLWRFLKRHSAKLRINWIWLVGMCGAFFIGLSIVIPSLNSDVDYPAEPTETTENAQQTAEDITYLQYQIANESVLGFELVRINNSGDAVIAGHAPNAARVIIELNGEAIGTVQSDKYGEWVFLTPTPLPTGHHRLTLEAISEDETTKIYGDQSLVMIVPQKSVIIQGDENDSEQPLVVLLPSDSESGSRVLSNQFAANKTPLGKHFTVNSIDYNNRGLLIIGGTVQATQIEMFVYLDNRPIARQRFEGQGAVPVNWDIKVDSKINPGLYQLRVDMVKDEQVILRRILPLQLTDVTQEDQEKDEYFIVKPGNSLWYIARNLLGEGAQHTTLFDANRQEIHDPDQIYPGQILTIPKKKLEENTQSEPTK